MDRPDRLTAALSEGRHDDFLRQLDAATRALPGGYSEAGRRAGYDASTFRRALQPGKDPRLKTIAALLEVHGLKLAVERRR